MVQREVKRKMYLYLFIIITSFGYGPEKITDSFSLKATKTASCHKTGKKYGCLVLFCFFKSCLFSPPPRMRMLYAAVTHPFLYTRWVVV